MRGRSSTMDWGPSALVVPGSGALLCLLSSLLEGHMLAISPSPNYQVFSSHLSPLFSSFLPFFPFLFPFSSPFFFPSFLSFTLFFYSPLTFPPFSSLPQHASNLPVGLKRLKFHSRFNHPIDLLPPTFTHLTFGYRCQPATSLPSTLSHLPPFHLISSQPSSKLPSSHLHPPYFWIPLQLSSQFPLSLSLSPPPLSPSPLFPSLPHPLVDIISTNKSTTSHLHPPALLLDTFLISQ